MPSLVLTQPMILPWRGIFEQAMLAEHFVFHDNIQLPRSHGKRKSFQTRVQIKSEAGRAWLSLPVAHTREERLIIDKARFSGHDWRQQHLKIIEKAYKDAPFFGSVMRDVVQDIYRFPTDSVCEFCMYGMARLFAYLHIDVRVSRSSQLGIPPDMKGSRRVLAHCLHFQADTYITGWGAVNYIDYDLFEENGVRIHYMDYSLKPYPQLHGPFNPYVSIIDLLFNVGPECGNYLGSPARYWREMELAAQHRVVK
jgi:hypothetical protein